MILNLIERAYALTGDDIGGLIVPNENETTIGDFVTQIITWIMYIAGVLAFIYLVVSGITFITAGGNAEQAKKGQQGLIYAIIGIVVVILAYVILQAAVGIGAGSAP